MSSDSEARRAFELHLERLRLRAMSLLEEDASARAGLDEQLVG